MPFYTSQKALAAAVGITPEHLSASKGGGLGDTTVEQLADITGIAGHTWNNPKKKATLNKLLRSFFAEQRKAKKEGIFN